MLVMGLFDCLGWDPLALLWMEIKSHLGRTKVGDVINMKFEGLSGSGLDCDLSGCRGYFFLTNSVNLEENC